MVSPISTYIRLGSGVRNFEVFLIRIFSCRRRGVEGDLVVSKIFIKVEPRQRGFHSDLTRICSVIKLETNGIWI